MAPRGLRHIGLKVISIALAALMWLLVSGEQIVERALRIPLEFTNLPAHLEITGSPPDVVDVRVRGSSGALSRIAAGELVAVLDLRSARSGQRLFHLAGTDVRAPFGIEVVQVAPSSLSVSFEPSTTKVVPIVPDVRGEPASGFAVGTITADPPTAEVVGPAGALRDLTEVITEPVSVGGVARPVTETVAVGVTDPTVRLRTPQSVSVTVNVTPAPVEWVIADVRVGVRNAARAVTLAPEHVSIRVRGPRESQRAGAVEFDGFVDVAGLTTGQYTLPVRVVPPLGIGIVEIQPALIRVRVR